MKRGLFSNEAGEGSAPNAAVTANASKERGITIGTMCEQNLDCIQGGTASYSRQKNVWWYRDTYTEPQDMVFCAVGGGVFIYRVMVSDASPIAVNAIISPSLSSVGKITNYYTLTGMQVGNPTEPGLYLCHGKKILVK